MHLQLLAVLSLSLLSFAAMEEQTVFDMPPEKYAPLTTPQPTLADLLTIESSASIFYSYARETELSAVFGEANAQSTVLVPTNKAVMALARKPHQGPTSVEPQIEITQQEFDELSKKNVENWVSAHIIPHSPIDISDDTYDTLLDGKAVSFKLEKGDANKPEWSRVLINGDVRIIGKKKALNGVMYLIDGTIKVD